MSTFQLPPWLSAQQQRVASLLEARLARVTRSAPPTLAEAMKYSLLDAGKRMRPVLCLTFADSVARTSGGGGSVSEDGAVALEFVHTYSLIHDDLPAMDDDDQRRGRPTSHKVFGEAMAILAGDALLTDAFAVLTGGTLSERVVRARLVAELAQAAGSSGMVGGQVLDIAEDRPASLEYLKRLHGMKTGALLRAACRMGAIAGGADDHTLEAADAYGTAVGLAFQIADDLLDVTATQAQLGKPTGADAAAGRPTFPAVVGLAEARAMASALVSNAQRAVGTLELEPGPLHALAAFAVERAS